MRTSTHQATTVGRVRKTLSLTAATCLLALPLAACDDQPEATSTPVPTTMPTAAPGRLAKFLGTGESMGWDGKATGQTADFGGPGPLQILPGNAVLLSYNSGNSLVRLDADGSMHKIANHPGGVSLFNGGVLALGIQGSKLAVLTTIGELVTLPVTGGVGKTIARVSFDGVPSISPARRLGAGLVPNGTGWIVQYGSRVVSVTDQGKVTPITLPVVPEVLTGDGDDLLVATMDSLVRLRDLKVADRTPFKLLNGSAPVAIVPDQRGGAYIATDRLASVIHAAPNRESEILAAATDSDLGAELCGAEQPGNPKEAPFRNLRGMAFRGSELLVASWGCNRVYVLGLKK